MTQFALEREPKRFICKGHWSVSTVEALIIQFDNDLPIKESSIIFDGEALTYLDSAGALFLFNCMEKLSEQNVKTHLENFSESHQQLLELIKKNQPDLIDFFKPHSVLSITEEIGKETLEKINQIDGFTQLLGQMTLKFFQSVKNIARFPFNNIIANIDQTGIKALPILALLSFLIGVVLAYQMGLQLQTYGANIFIAYLSGLAIFREFAPLITAIIVAGRTSSAFTAQLGSMKINEELDAISTMGLSPVQLLVLPKVLGLIIVFPLLIFWSDIFSLIGAMILSKSMLSVSYYDFLMRLKESVGVKQMFLGLYKAPAFALVIALVGCFQGMQVALNADSIGRQTTKSVVQALFLIIIIDAGYSIIYSWLDL